MTVTSLGAESAAAQPSGRRLEALSSQDRWSNKAPKGLCAVDPTTPEGWRAWQEHLKQRKSPESKLLRSVKHHPLAWGVADPSGEWANWLAQIKLKKKAVSTSIATRIEEWIAQSREQSGSLRHAQECLAWAGLLPGLAQHLEPRLWWSLCDELLTTSEEGAFSFDNDLSDTALPESVLLHQIVAGELPLKLAGLLPELKPLQALASPARDTLSEGLLAWTDGEGLLHARLLPVAAALFACWTRCRAMADHKSKGSWSEEADTQFEWLVRQCLRLVNRDGAFPLSPADADVGMIDCFKTALELGGDDEDFSAAAQRLRGVSARDDDDPPSPANHSEWSGLGVLSCGWGDKAPKIVVAYYGSELQIEIRNRGASLVRGHWPIDVRVNGTPLTPQGEWDCSCWYSDEDCDYLDLSIDLENGYELERQIMLAREDGVATISEVILSNGDALADQECLANLPLAPGVAFEGEEETREGWLTSAGKRIAGLIPLSLPEWRVEQRIGECAQGSEHSLDIYCSGRGRNLASVIWLDFSPSRFAKQRTWRQLTVAQSLEKVSHDVAVGYRVQAGKRQWLFYRSLDPAANRTVLGHNLSSEALTGRFLSTGEVDEYFEIGDDDD